MNFKFWNAGGGKAEGMVHVVKNLDTVEIPAGAPCIFNFNGTDDGLSVVLPSTAGAAKVAAFTAGPAVKTIPVGALQNVQVYGFNRYTRILRSTRAASTNDWAAGTVAFAVGDLLVPDTTGNAWIKSGVATAGVKSPVVVVSSMPVFSSRASSNNGENAASATAYYEGVKTFVRFM